MAGGRPRGEERLGRCGRAGGQAGSWNRRGAIPGGPLGAAAFCPGLYRFQGSPVDANGTPITWTSIQAWAIGGPRKPRNLFIKNTCLFSHV